MPRDDDTGRRLLANVIDSHATNNPTRVWASVPVNDEDLTQGFRDITYKEFADAINLASWWLAQNVANATAPFQTIAYSGPKDLRYPILAMAAVKCGKQLLLASSFSTSEALIHLLNVTNCTLYLHAASMKEKIQSAIGADSNVPQRAVPELSEWLFAGEARTYPYGKTWEEACSDPWLIFHTSGTTGLPKPVVYTNLMMTSFDAAELMPDADQETMNDLFRDTRCYAPLPHLHYVGMTAALQWTAFLNMVLVNGPSTSMTSDEVLQLLQFGKVSGMVVPPSVLDDICRHPQGVDRLRKLQYIYFAGAPLSAATAEHLVGHCQIQPGMGSTEAGAYFISVRNDDDWKYYGFRPSMGVEFEQRTPELFELVFRRKTELARWQQVFHLYPDLDVFPTKDLWAKHPSKPGLWRYMARTDDLIVLSHGEGLWASEMEADIQKHPSVRTALIGGQGQPHPFVIIELVDETAALGRDKASRLVDIWPAIARANEKCSDPVKLTKELVLFTHPDKPLTRTAKATVPKPSAFTLYSAEIENLYPQ